MENFGINEKSYNLLTDFFKQHEEVQIVKVWGSRLDGTYHSSSDIDLIIKFTHKTNIYILEKEINKLPIPYRIQITDIDYEKFDTLGIYIYNESPIFYEKN